MVLKAAFVKRDPRTQAIISREYFYFSSLPTQQIVSFHDWYHQHVEAIKTNFDNFQSRDSDLEYDGVDCLFLKFSLFPDRTGQAHFELPKELKNKQAVINVDTSHSCFKYALLSILHYKDVSQHRYRASKYDAWKDELKFDDVDVNNVNIKKDVCKIEKQNNIKINIHLWERGALRGCRYNNVKVLANTIVNLLLVVNAQGQRHYCGIPSLSRLYYHTKTAHIMRQNMCDRCCRSFKNAPLLEEHYQLCLRGRLQVEGMPTN